MKRYTVAELRQHLSRALDEAARGERVLVDRRGERFILSREVRRASVRPTQPRFFEVLDPVLWDGQWGFELHPEEGVRFVPDRRESVGPAPPKRARRR